MKGKDLNKVNSLEELSIGDLVKNLKVVHPFYKKMNGVILEKGKKSILVLEHYIGRNALNLMTLNQLTTYIINKSGNKIEHFDCYQIDSKKDPEKAKKYFKKMEKSGVEMI